MAGWLAGALGPGWAAVGGMAMASSHEFFRDPVWLEANGNVVLPHTCETYFTGSPWYERTCLNEQWKAQGAMPTEEQRR